jgi:hypothetical protein
MFTKFISFSLLEDKATTATANKEGFKEGYYLKCAPTGSNTGKAATIGESVQDYVWSEAMTIMLGVTTVLLGLCALAYINSPDVYYEFVFLIATFGLFITGMVFTGNTSSRFLTASCLLGIVTILMFLYKNQEFLQTIETLFGTFTAPKDTQVDTPDKTIDNVYFLIATVIIILVIIVASVIMVTSTTKPK